MASVPTPKDKGPMRPKEAMADKGKGRKGMPKPQQSLEDCCRAPHRPPEHMAAKGTHVDGLAKHAQMQDETRKPVREKNIMAPAGSATGS